MQTDLPPCPGFTVTVFPFMYVSVYSLVLYSAILLFLYSLALLVHSLSLLVLYMYHKTNAMFRYLAYITCIVYTVQQGFLGTGQDK